MTQLEKRKMMERCFAFICRGMTLLAVVVLCVLLVHVVKEGFAWLNYNFLTHFPSRFPHKAGLKSALWGTFWLIGLTAMIAIPFGVFTAIYLQEYAPKSRLIKMVKINIANLAGMPSIIYGLLGLTIFVRFFGLDRSIWEFDLKPSYYSDHCHCVARGPKGCAKYRSVCGICSRSEALAGGLWASSTSGAPGYYDGGDFSYLSGHW